MIRLFVALPVPPEAAERLLSVRAGLPGVRWRQPESLHVTLRFIGDVPEDVGADAAEALSSVRGEPFEVRARGHGVFRTGPRLRAIFSRVESAPPLERLKRRVDRALDRVAPEARRRRFTPHVTLARTGRETKPRMVAAHLESIGGAEAASWAVEELALYSSQRGREESSYFVEESVPLGAAAGGERGPARTDPRAWPHAGGD